MRLDPQLLKEVNADLWRIEDKIRAKERAKDFGETLTSLPRSVDVQNDRRAAIKSEINSSYVSDLTEEKREELYSPSSLQTRAAPCLDGVTRQTDARQSSTTASQWSSSDAVLTVDNGFTLASVLLVSSGVFCLTTLFFGTKGGFYDSDDYDGNGTAH